jgi:dihydroxyacid dehydratase/phosphogluconate dehydratase
VYGFSSTIPWPRLPGTNAPLSIPAIAHEAGIVFHFGDIDKVFRGTPLPADRTPVD